ncbi:MAG: exo-alpha-sialidase [Nitrospinae bacterium]|nr:exo-alpha-sialidase [Nitrospinota bacterium]MBL7019359.1 exo-alpha-sialidase [Nitrospinaceae bacterium]
MIDATFLHNPHDKGMFCHCPSILETQSGTLLVVWYTYPEDEYIGATLTLAKKLKGSGDNTWSTGESILSSQKYSLGNPVLFQDPGGRIHLLYVTLKGSYWNDACLQGVWSDDEGQTWSSPIQLWKTPGMMVRHPPVLLDSGSFLLPAYDEHARQSVLLSSDPPYSNWQATHRFETPEIIQPAIVKESSGRLTLVFRPSTDPRKIRICHSTNQGKTWTQPQMTSLPNPLSGVSAFSANNNLVVVYNHTEEHQRWPLSASWSRNGGKTWEKVLHLDKVQLEVSYPSFISGNNKLVHGVYTYNRRMIKYVKFRENSLI